MSRVVVTGGSRGLGLAFTRWFLDRGDSVAACARTATPEVRELERAHADRYAFAELDLVDDDAPRALVELAVERFGGVDVLVNNAAAGQDGLLAHTSDEEIARLVALNVTGAIRVARQAVRRMLPAGGGTILNVSSVCATRGYAGLTVYSATKGALEAFTRSLAREVGGHGIRVVGVAPGFFESEMSSVLAPAQIDSIRRRTPTGELATPEQVVRAASALLEPGANVSGTVVVVDGGMTA
jgi:3-oxoacyl-[acyl-carrier protein] reductase